MRNTDKNKQADLAGSLSTRRDRLTFAAPRSSQRSFFSAILALSILSTALITAFGQVSPASGVLRRPQAPARLSERRVIDRAAERSVLTNRIRNINLGTATSSRLLSPYSSVRLLRQQVESMQMQDDEDKGYLQSYLYWLRQRAFPNDTIDWTDYAVAFAERDVMDTATFAVPGLPPASRPRWEFVGPQNLPVPYRQYYGQGTTSGRVNGIAFDPAHPGTYYIASAGGGLWKTQDRGRTWSSLSNGPEWASLKTSSVAIDSTNNIIYVGTGDFDGGRSVYGFGLLKSEDGGDTWTSLLRSELAGQSVHRILIDPESPKTVTVTAGRNQFEWGKVWRTTDGGDHWTAVLTVDADWSDLHYSAPLAETPNVRVYYAVGDSDRGGEVWRSMNRGESWTKLATPLVDENQFGLDLCTSPTAPKTVYLLSGPDKKIWKSIDAGDTWQDTTNNFPHNRPNPPKPNYNWHQINYDCYITCATRSDTGADVLYVGLIDLVASVDGGSTWESIGKSYYDDAATHNDQHCLEVNPSDPQEVLFGNDGGIYRLSYAPSASVPWTIDTSLNAKLGLTQFYQSAYHPTDTRLMIGGAQDNASPISVGGGATDAPFAGWANPGGGDGGFCAINPSNPNVQYLTEQELVIYRTGNGWGAVSDDQSFKTNITYSTKALIEGKIQDVNWSRDPVDFIAPIALDPNNPGRLYAGTNYLWRWDDSKFDPQNINGGWTKHLGNQMLASGDNPFITAIAIAPSDSNRIYTGSGSGEIWMTTDGGSTWLPLNSGSPAFPRYSIKNIAVDPNNPDSILVGLSGTSSLTFQHPGHIWQCSNTRAANRIWKNLASGISNGLPNIPLNTIAIDPGNPTRVYYVGTDVGVFVTNNGGRSWGNATTNLGLPNVQVNDLKIVPGTGYLMAATFGRGIWRLKLPTGLQPLNLTFHSSSINTLNTAWLNQMIRATRAVRVEAAGRSQ